jgi:hypothetical protein
MMNETETVHAFEKAGLGKAPFTYKGTRASFGPIKMVDASGMEWSIGAPGQPMGSCAYCGQGIGYLCDIESADGKRFVVGQDCVKKTGDAGLTRKVNAHVRARTAKAKASRDADKLARLKTFMGNPEALEGRPHPKGFVDRATGQALTLRDYAEWMYGNAGTKGKLALLKLIEG